MNAVIEAEHLRKTFGSLVAVDDLSFSVAAGECFGILGPNGAGKTSTIRMVYAFSPPSGGTLHVLGLDITRQARAVKSRIGVCQQENNIDPDLTVLQNLEVFARYFNIPAAEATRRSRELLRFMALDHRESSRAVDLSGGMIRRLVMARALLNRPELLILDEPTQGFDPVNRRLLMDLIDEQKRDGATVIMVTHQMDEVERLCDRVILLKDGVAAAYGTVEEVQDTFGATTIRVDCSREVPASELYDVVSPDSNSVILAPRPGADAAEILRGLVTSGVGVRSFTTERTSLEEIFIRVYGEQHELAGV